jgi:putative ATP-dependent endonuclease of OLD family
MRITRVEIHNYRNLDEVTISFDPDCNFIVGENNLGKSNLLSLLNTLFSYRSFVEDDFADSTKPIYVILQLTLADIEIGHFQDLFDADDYKTINIICQQITLDDNIEFYHLETKTSIQANIVRCVNYVYYESLRNPGTEINFDKGRGVGRFLNSLIRRYLEANKIGDKDLLQLGQITSLATALNTQISKIKSFKDFDISAAPDNDIENVISKLIVLKDGDGNNLTKAGQGIQFLILVTLALLEKIQTIMKRRGDRGIFEDESTGEKTISLVLGLDEPEIHLHPYMQRSLIKYLNDIVNNNNMEFKLLVKELFGIDNFTGQIMVVTHSPNIILNDYKQIVRFYVENRSIKIVSGSTVGLDRQLTKHLYLNFPYIKEAFFARCVILVEGDSEFASLPLFALRLASPIDFDDLGICVIQARGQAVPQLMKLASIYGIKSVGVSDRDHSETDTAEPNHFQTKLRDFDEEIVSLVDRGKESILRDIVARYDPLGCERVCDSAALNKYAVGKYAVVSKPYAVDLKLAAIPITDLIGLKSYYLTWFSINKSYPLGKIIGESLSEEDIPNTYLDVIQAALKLL